MKAAERNHLSDDQMVAVYAGADTKLRHVDSTLEHLSRCPRCAERYQLLADRISGLRNHANAEADAVFSQAQLDDQRAQIMARLEHLAHPARVIPFPAGRANTGFSIFTGNQVRRWIAAAAAAGLIIGVTLGRLADFGGTPAQPGAQVQQPATAAPTYHAVEPPQAANDDEIVLSRMDRSLYMEPVQALEALDAITPQPQQVALRVRR